MNLLLLLEGVLLLLNGVELLGSGLVILICLLVFGWHSILIEWLREWLLNLRHIELVGMDFIPIILQLLAVRVLCVHHTPHVVESQWWQHLLVVRGKEVLDATLTWWRRQQEVQLTLRLGSPTGILRKELDHFVRILVVVGIGQAHDKLVERLSALPRSEHGRERGPANLRPEQLLLLRRLRDVPVGRGRWLPQLILHVRVLLDRREIIVNTGLLHRQGGWKFLQIDLLVILVQEVASLEEVLLRSRGRSLLGEELGRILERLLIHHHLIRRAADSLGLRDVDGVASCEEYVGGEGGLELVVVELFGTTAVGV